MSKQKAEHDMQAALLITSPRTGMLADGKQKQFSH
jgi:hypothetical protein